MYEVGDLVRITAPGRLIFEDRGSDLGEFPLKGGEIAIVLKDNSGVLANTGSTLVFLYVYVDGRDGWIMDSIVEGL